MLRQSLFEIKASDEDILSRVARAKGLTEKFVLKKMEEKDPYWLETEEGLAMWKNHVYIPKDQKLREDIIRMHHDLPHIGHPGIHRTEELITRNYWWPYISKDVKAYVTGCETCQRTKADRQKRRAPLRPNAVPERPWEVITWDIIGPLPLSKGYNGILVIVDRFTKRMLAEPINMDLTSEGAARIMRDWVFRDHGLPRKVISDRGPQFVSGFMKELYQLLGIEGNLSTAYHPQTDGQTERVNQEIEQYLRIFVNHHQDDWAEWVPLAEFSYNDKQNSSTGCSPFFLEYGQHPWK